MDKKEILANSLIHRLIVDTFGTEDYLGFNVTKVEDGKVDIEVHIKDTTKDGSNKILVEKIEGIYPVIDFIELPPEVNPTTGYSGKRISLKMNGVKVKE